MILYLYRTNWNIRCFFFLQRPFMCLPLYSVSYIALFLSFELHFWITMPFIWSDCIYTPITCQISLAFYKMIFSYRVCEDGVKCRGGGISTIISLRKGRRFLSQRLWLNLNLQQSIVRYEGGKKNWLEKRVFCWKK